MEISWITRLRIFASLAIGAVLVGFLPWHLVRPAPDAGSVFAVFAGSISVSDILICAVLAFAAGFIASAVCTPYGSQIGIIAAPAGLAIWGLKTSPISKLFQIAPAVTDRMQVYSRLKFEGLIWLALVVCGFAGALAADKIFRRKEVSLPDQIKPFFPLPDFAQITIAIIGTVFAANLLVNIFAVDVGYPDSGLNRVTAQPANAQIAFAVFIAFGICGFLTKLFLNSKAYWPATASVIVIYYSIITYGGSKIMAHLAAYWPPVFFVRPVMAVLPVQMVAFGCLGAVWGHWLAVSYNIWRTHQA